MNASTPVAIAHNRPLRTMATVNSSVFNRLANQSCARPHPQPCLTMTSRATNSQMLKSTSTPSVVIVARTRRRPEMSQPASMISNTPTPSTTARHGEAASSACAPESNPANARSIDCAACVGLSSFANAEAVKTAPRISVAAPVYASPRDPRPITCSRYIVRGGGSSRTRLGTSAASAKMSGKNSRSGAEPVVGTEITARKHGVDLCAHKHKERPGTSHAVSKTAQNVRGWYGATPAAPRASG